MNAAFVETHLGVLGVLGRDSHVVAIALADSADDLRRMWQLEFGSVKAGSVEVGSVEVSSSVEVAGWLEPLITFLTDPSTCLDLPLNLSGTPFQLQVWDYLRTIPVGETRTYGDVAAAVGKPPTAARAVANACAANKFALAVPCHRVLPRGGGISGGVGGYRWGCQRKRALLALEAQTPLLTL
jgi:AraC family transcriptional regulator of adaptative response/methylated-DNA-[protein]-cysteine methyltransferase